MQKRWSILIVPNTSEQGYNFNITASGLKKGALAICLIVVACIVVLGASVHSWKYENAKKVDSLTAQLEARAGELASLKAAFARVTRLEEKLRTIAGLKPRHNPVPEAGGRGGPETAEMHADDTSLLPHVSADIEGMSSEALRAALVSTRESFADILETFEREQDRLSNTPSLNPVSSPDAWISSGFGYRDDPIHGARRFHEGVDIVAPRNTPVIAPAEGVVTFTGWRAGLGRTIEITHGFGYRTTYGHNAKLMVKKGDRVKRGDTIALLGSSGRSTGPHLHYEVRENSKLVNPYTYVIE